MGPLSPPHPSGKGQRLAWTPRHSHYSAQLLLLRGQVTIFQLHPIAYGSYSVARSHLWPDTALSPPGEILGLRSRVVQTYPTPVLPVHTWRWRYP